MSDDSDKKSETKPDPEGSAQGKSIDQLKEDLGKASEKIEKMEEKIADQQKTTESIKGRKSEGTTLVLSIVLGIMGIMGVGHIYLGRVKRGIIVLIIGLFGWTGIFIPLVILGLLEEGGAEFDDPGPVLGIVGIMVGVIGGMIALFFWQIFNSRKLCRQYNEYYEEHDKPPW